MEESFFSNLYLLFLIIIGLGAAWYLGYRSRNKASKIPRKGLARDYFIGLNYLLNDEPDDAIDIFTAALELNSNTLETYMALGTLLRRRGKVDKSLAVYQDLLAWPHLTQDEHAQVKVELVRSYIAAGLLDRAESLLEELSTAPTEIKIEALIQGITVYQIEKEWLKAIDVCSQLLKICPPSLRELYRHQSSHFFCELAQNEIALQHYSVAKDYLKKSFQMDANNVRASLITGALELEQGNYYDAIKVLSKVSQQDDCFIAEAFPLLLEAYQKSALDKKLEKFIQTCLDSKYSSRVLIEITGYIEKQSGLQAANDFLKKYLKAEPSLSLLSRALLLTSILTKTQSSQQNVSSESLSLFHNILASHIKAQALYKCDDCGFELKHLHWMCPSCSNWGSVKPANSSIHE